VQLPVQRHIKRAEMWAFLQVLMYAIPPLTIYTDHLAIVQGLQRGEKWCCSASRAHADLWRKIWHKKADVGDGVEVRHCKAHTSKSAQRCMSPDDRRIAVGNSHADQLAKAGAEDDLDVFGREQTLKDIWSRVTWALSYLSEVTVSGPRWGDTQELPPRTRNRVKKRRVKQVQRPHRLLPGTEPGSYHCWKCKASARTNGGVARLRRQECKGSAVASLRTMREAEGSATRYAVYRGHSLMKTGDIFWCGRCGLYTVARVRGLALQCNTRPSCPSILRRLQAGKHPRTGVRQAQEPRRLLRWEWDRLLAQQASTQESGAARLQ
jgi:hypothetical protein